MALVGPLNQNAPARPTVRKRIKEVILRCILLRFLSMMMWMDKTIADRIEDVYPVEPLTLQTEPLV